MLANLVKHFSSVFVACAVTVACATFPGAKAGPENGVVVVDSAYPLDETISRVKADIADKGIMFFLDVDQSKLAKGADIELRPSHLLIFGNPPLGIQFLTSNPVSGLDWPVRLLVFEDGSGKVRMAYNDFTWVAHRHGITDRDPQFKMAMTVIESITSAVRSR
jgi:uncharacterized protein (DUF302 family)